MRTGLRLGEDWYLGEDAVLGTNLAYDPDDWLVTLDRALKAYLLDAIADPDVLIEMSFPDTREWTKKLPLDKAIIHFEQDHISDPTFGFGSPGDDVFDDSDPANVVSLHREAAQHLVNFDVGVWVSAEAGGVTKRKELVQALKNLLVPNGAKAMLEEATGGIWPVSFEGGRNELDRINDVPIWRALDMTLIVRVVSRYTPPEPFAVPTSFTQNEQLTIHSEDGSSKPVATP